MLAILDYKAGNQTSVSRALNALGIVSAVTADPALIREAKGLIFPGVGAAGQAMRYLRESGMDLVLREAVAFRKPLLGICLGCQILLESSDENTTPTLGLLAGRCRRFDPSLRDQGGLPIRIPHMGWNSLRHKRSSPLLQGLAQDASFYFVHSYYAECPPELTIATSVYGREFCAVYGHDGLWACQFHPEKSGTAGLRILKNFSTYCTENAHVE
jgi:glutamine amidotransferase